MRKLNVYHCFFCGFDFGLFNFPMDVTPSCPCCRNEDDVLFITEMKTGS
jgi:hypothetical protein